MLHPRDEFDQFMKWAIIRSFRETLLEFYLFWLVPKVDKLTISINQYLIANISRIDKINYLYSFNCKITNKQMKQTIDLLNNIYSLEMLSLLVIFNILTHGFWVIN